LKEAEVFKKIAKKITNAEHVFILGRGVSYPTALESSLKIKEVSYIHSEVSPEETSSLYSASSAPFVYTLLAFQSIQPIG
jgi:DNA-binding MurR/RpiR family transcriptional regulator